MVEKAKRRNTRLCPVCRAPGARIRTTIIGGIAYLDCVHPGGKTDPPGTVRICRIGPGGVVRGVTA